MPNLLLCACSGDIFQNSRKVPMSFSLPQPLPDRPDPANVLGRGFERCVPHPSWRAVAKTIGLSEASLHRLRRGVKPFDADTVRLLAEASGTDPVELLLALVGAGSAEIDDQRAHDKDAMSVAPEDVRLDAGDTLYLVHLDVQTFTRAAVDSHEFIDLAAHGVDIRFVMPAASQLFGDLETESPSAAIVHRLGSHDALRRYRAWKTSLEESFPVQREAIHERINLYTVKDSIQLVGFGPGLSYVVVASPHEGAVQHLAWADVVADGARVTHSKRVRLPPLHAELIGGWCSSVSHWAASGGREGTSSPSGEGD